MRSKARFYATPYTWKWVPCICLCCVCACVYLSCKCVLINKQFSCYIWSGGRQRLITKLLLTGKSNHSSLSDHFFWQMTQSSSDWVIYASESYFKRPVQSTLCVEGKTKGESAVQFSGAFKFEFFVFQGYYALLIHKTVIYFMFFFTFIIWHIT